MFLINDYVCFIDCLLFWASMRIHAKCEDVSRLLMDKLGVPIPEFRLRRYVLNELYTCVLHIL